MLKRIVILSLLLAWLFVSPGSVLAQAYFFRLPQETVHVFYNEDGTVSIDYLLVFDNQPAASPIEFVDLGLPNADFDVDSITAEVDGNPITFISEDEFQGTGTGVALGLGPYAIPPGESGQVHVFIGTVRRMLYPDDADENYVSTNFVPAYFDSSVITGVTDLTVTFHLPPGVQPEEPRWHASPPGFPDEPETALDDQGQVTYTWRNTQATMDRAYLFGASFPRQYVPETAIVRPGTVAAPVIDAETVIGFLFCCGFFAFIGLIIVLAFRSTQKRKLQYLPPKIAIEGHGIKRGLTAVEAAILLEQPLDKILTMVLFAVVKKNAASVTSRDPLELDVALPLPEGLNPYEVDFLKAFQESDKRKRRTALQEMMVDLVKSVAQKMKGFSRRETVAYYRDIINRAWAQVEAADTPEVKSEKYDEVMEWTMMDRNYGERTRDVFRTGPVFVPVWWPRYDPTFSRGGTTTPVSRPGGAPSTPSGGGISLPHLPGSDFAASIVGGVQGLSSSVIGNLNEFTGRITQRTNPEPVATATRSTSGKSGGGCACACACACAGCACACAGGGR